MDEVAGVKSASLERLSSVRRRDVKMSAPVCDGIRISEASQKKIAWVRLLNAMPDIRPEKITRNFHPISNRELANSLIRSIA